NKPGNWNRVSATCRCPICKEAHWCSISGDGTVAKCMRIQDGSFLTKTDKNGADYYLHRLKDSLETGPSRPPCQAGPAPQRASAETVPQVYTALLGQLELTTVHRENLRNRGLTDEAIDRGEYRSLPVSGWAAIARQLSERFGDTLLRVPGFVVKESQ